MTGHDSDPKTPTLSRGADSKWGIEKECNLVSLRDLFKGYSGRKSKETSWVDLWWVVD